MSETQYQFVWNERLQMPLPLLKAEWESLSAGEQEQVLQEWEEIRGRIPEQIIRFEAQIIARQSQLDVEEDFALSCRLNSEIADYASRINDLHLWFRVDQEVTAKPHT